MSLEIVPLAPNMAAFALRQVERQLRRVSCADWWDPKDRARLVDLSNLAGTLAKKCAGSYSERERQRKDGRR